MGLYGDLGNILTPQETFAKTRNIVKWGNQIQGHFLKVDKNQQVDFCLQSFLQQDRKAPFSLLPEWGSWMVELVPKEAFDNQLNLQKIVLRLREKYQYFQKAGRMMLTIPNIPFLGLKKENKKISNQITMSDFLGDDYVTNHVRVKTMVKNIMQRKGCKMSISVPLFMDLNTDLEEISLTQPNPHFINMDSVVFGSGISCLQCTFSTENLFNTQYIYDQMHIISPLMLALTAGTPFFKGKVSNWDVRWGVLEQGFDCRSIEEKNIQSQFYIPNSRYSASRTFIWAGSLNKQEFSNLKVKVNPELKQILKNKAQQNKILIKQNFLNHFASIISRDLLFVTERIAKLTGESQDLFDMFNCQNYLSVRLKIPLNENTGWRAQFRTMDVQLTPEENSAYSLLLYFFNRVMLQKQNIVNLYLPISFVKQNFNRAHLANAAINQKFYFRTNIFSEDEPIVEEFYLKQIFFGSKEGTKFVGIFKYLLQTLLNQKQKQKQDFITAVKDLMRFLEEKVQGKRLTLAQWMRNYIKKHPEYKKNSILPKSTMDDMLKILYAISQGSIKDENFRQIFTLDKKI